MKQLFSWVNELIGPRKNVAYYMESAGRSAETGNLEEAEKSYRQALELAEECKDYDNIAGSAAELGRICQAQGKYAVAETFYKRAYQTWEESEDNDSAAQCLVVLGRLYMLQHRLTDAEGVLHYAVRIYQSQHGNESVKVADVCSLLADCCLQKNSYTEAQTLLHRAQQIYEKSYESNHPVLAVNLYSLAHAYYQENDHQAAERLYQRALDIFDQEGKDCYSQYAHIVCSCCHELARSLITQGKKDEGQALLQRACSIANQYPGYLNEAELVDEAKKLAGATA